MIERIKRFLKRLMVRRVIKNGRVYYVYKGEFYPEYLNKGDASSFIIQKAKQYCRGKGIDVGADRWPFPGAVPIQNEEEQNAYKLDKFPDQSLDYVFSSHCLEHLFRWEDVLRLWTAKLKYGGILFLYLPHESMYLWHPGQPWVGDTHKWIPNHKIVNTILESCSMEIIDYNPGKDEYWSFHIVAKKK